MSTSQWSTTSSLSTKSNYIPNNEEGILSANDKASNDYFGYSVSMSSDNTRVSVGAYAVDLSGYIQTGAAYIFS